MATIKLNGWREDPSCNEDYKFCSAGLIVEGTTPNKYDLLPWSPPVEQQAELSSCVGNSVVSALEIRNLISGKQHVDLSRLFVYYNARVAMNETHADQGCYIRDAMKSLATFGTCSESTWQYDVSNVYIRPPWRAYREAYMHRIGAYYRIDHENFDQLCSEIEIALAAKHPVVFGVKIWSEFQQCSGDVRLPDVSKSSIGSHAMCIVGYDRSSKQFLVRNSWGESWGDSGHCRMPYEYLRVGEAKDFWVLTV